MVQIRRVFFDLILVQFMNILIIFLRIIGHCIVQFFKYLIMKIIAKKAGRDIIALQEKNMNELLLKDIAESAGNFHNKGYNCAESVFLAFRGIAAPDLSEDMVRLATPFGGGLGRSGCICGAISGAVMIIGAAKGRVTPDIPRKQSYDLSSEYHNRFKNKFGATCCRVLVKDEFGSKGQADRCFQIITGSAELLMNFLIEKGVVTDSDLLIK